MSITAEQFNHKYELEFGQPISFYSSTPETTNIVPFRFSERATEDASKINQFMRFNLNNQAVKITQHNISFNIAKGKESSSETKITLYNISDDVRLFLEEYNGSKPFIALKAGYETDKDIPIIFTGEVLFLRESFDGVTRTTELTCTTGTTAITEAYTTKSYRYGTPPRDIIEDVAKDLKLPKGTIFFPEEMNVGIQKPVVVSGVPTMEFLRKFSKEFNAKAFIEDGTINIVPNNFVMRDGQFVFRISPEINMIGSPTVATDAVESSEKQAGNRQNVTVTTTLNGAYSIGAIVQLDSKYHTGAYEIVSIVHSGEYEGTDWKSTLELKPADSYQVRS